MFAPLNVQDFGAIGDGRTMCTHSIQAAIDKASSNGGGVVNLPSGIYLSGSLHMRSYVELHLDKGATLLGSNRRKDYERGNWFSLILADGQQNIALTGDGTVDGQGKALAQDVLRMVETGEVKIPRKGWRPSEVDRPEILEFQNCQQVRIQGVTIKNGACWVQTYRKCVGLVIQGVRVDSKTYWNNDGFDIVDCQNVKVADCDVDAADDGICLKSEDPKSACENILVENCRVRSSASAIKFGTASYGGFRNIKIANIQVRDTYRSAIALESVDGGVLENILVENVKAVNTGNAFFIRLGHRNRKAPPGKVHRILLRNFDVQVPTGQPDAGYPFQGPPVQEPHNLCPSSIVGNTDAPIEDVRLQNIKIRVGGGGSRQIADRSLDQVPERPSDYPEFTMFGEVPAWAAYFRHINGLKIEGFTVTLDQSDFRPAFAADDVTGFSAAHLKVEGADPNPTIVLRKTQKVQIDPRLNPGIKQEKTYL